ILAHLLELRTLSRPVMGVVFVCPHCRQVQSLNKEEFIAGQMVLRPREFENVLLEWCECDEASCTLEMPLYPLWSPEITEFDERLDVQHWIWDSLRCPAGHGVSRPANL